MKIALPTNKEINQNRESVSTSVNTNKVDIDRSVFEKTESDKDLLKRLKKSSKEIQNKVLKKV